MARLGSEPLAPHRRIGRASDAAVPPGSGFRRATDSSPMSSGAASIIPRAGEFDRRKVVVLGAAGGHQTASGSAPASSPCPITIPSLCQRISPAASRRACSRLSAMCQLSSTRQLDWLDRGAVLRRRPRQNPTASAAPSDLRVDIEPIEKCQCRTCQPSACRTGEICDATTNGMSSCKGRICSAASCRVNQSLLELNALALEQPADDRRAPRPDGRAGPSGRCPVSARRKAALPGRSRTSRGRLVMWSSCTMRWATLKGWW